MKKTLILVAMLFAGICFSSCSKDDGGGNISKKLVGMWVETADEEGAYGGIEDLYEISETTIIQYWYDKHPYYTSFSSGYLLNCTKEDFYKDFETKYSIENDGSMWVFSTLFGKMDFLNNDKLKITRDDEYFIWERVKGFK